MNVVSVSKVIIFSILNFCVMFVQGAEVEIPYTFKDGQVTSAQQMNLNFAAIKKAINENYAELNGDEISVGSSRFIGFSKEWTNGSEGLFELQRACQVFSSESHVCSAQEISRSKYSEGAMKSIRDGDQAWVRGNPQLIGGKDIELSCWGEQQSSGSPSILDVAREGLAVNTQGIFSSEPCSLTLRVACCE